MPGCGSKGHTRALVTFYIRELTRLTKSFGIGGTDIKTLKIAHLTLQTFQKDGTKRKTFHISPRSR